MSKIRIEGFRDCGSATICVFPAYQPIRIGSRQSVEPLDVSSPDMTPFVGRRRQLIDCNFLGNGCVRHTFSSERHSRHLKFVNIRIELGIIGHRNRFCFLPPSTAMNGRPSIASTTVPSGNLRICAMPGSAS